MEKSLGIVLMEKIPEAAAAGILGMMGEELARCIGR
jgi:hypothetical protein